MIYIVKFKLNLFYKEVINLKLAQIESKLEEEEENINKRNILIWSESCFCKLLSNYSASIICGGKGTQLPLFSPISQYVVIFPLP